MHAYPYLPIGQDGTLTAFGHAPFRPGFRNKPYTGRSRDQHVSFRRAVVVKELQLLKSALLKSSQYFSQPILCNCAHSGIQAAKRASQSRGTFGEQLPKIQKAERIGSSAVHRLSSAWSEKVSVQRAKSVRPKILCCLFIANAPKRPLKRSFRFTAQPEHFFI